MIIFNSCNFFPDGSIWSTRKTLQFCKCNHKAKSALTNENKVLAGKENFVHQDSLQNKTDL